MRSNEEQLNVIMQKKSAAERNRRRNRRIAFSALALVLCLSVVLSYVVISGKQVNKPDNDENWGFDAPDNTDGVIGGTSNSINGEAADGVLEDKEIAENAIGTAPDFGYTGEREPTSPDDVVAGSSPSYSQSTSQTAAGTLTGGELKDNADYDKWLETAKSENWNSLGEKWKLSTAKRVTVNVAGCFGAVVSLLDNDGKALHKAVTNAEGVAYLFVGEQEVVKTVAVSAGGKTATTEYNGTEYSFDMESQSIPTKLDLMFVVDTTGSMGDELEYLKTEIADVINRISSKDIDVRTSVNFYRDEGDNYVVKYHGFNTDANAVQGIVKQQSADGGGDYEEAVHTALHNAVYDHAWEENSVKVMFLVLDAPPHDNAEVIETLSKAVNQAAAMGIRIVPVAASGVDKSTEGLLRSIALVTGGTYTFLTDHSGIGNPHLPPSTDSYDVEPLNDMLVRITLEYCGIKTEKTTPNPNQQQ